MVIRATIIWMYRLAVTKFILITFTGQAAYLSHESFNIIIYKITSWKHIENISSRLSEI